jgi:SAM-dependent methyltransferase
LVVENDGNFVPVNVRSPEQWAAIRRVYDFDGKDVLDIGCGRGDLMLYAQNAGAYVIGVDNNRETVAKTIERGVSVILSDLELYLKSTVTYYDVAFCFSVLPYVNMDRTLFGLWNIADVTFIECQLEGDGPGKLTEQALRNKLLVFWNKVTKIGFTVVEGRNTIRPIWMCEKGEK